MKQENNAVVITSIIAAVILIIAFTGFYLLKNPSSENSVTVQGNANIKAVPDLVSVYLNIQTKGNTSSEAKDANTEIYNKLIDGIVALGFDEPDIKTESYSIYPNIIWRNGKQTEEGFIATHALKIEFSTDKIEKLTYIIDAGVDAGAGINYINFELTQESQNNYKAQALKLAAEDARIKAESVAGGLDKEVGKLISVSVSDFGYSPWNIYTAKSGGYGEDAATAREVATAIQPSGQDINAVVSATFKLK